MKKITVFLATALCALSVSFAQEPGFEGDPRFHQGKFNKEEFIKNRCNEMADNLALIGKKRENFVKLYSDFTKEINSLARTRVRPGECETEEEVEKAILNNFEISEKILKIRENYYSKFKTILMPSQIQLMYQSEFSIGHHFKGAPGSMPPPPTEGGRNGNEHPL